MRIPTLALVVVLAGWSTQAAAQAITVPDLSVYGLQDFIPEPAELDGNPDTIEFTVSTGTDYWLINPAKAGPFPGWPCIEPLGADWPESGGIRAALAKDGIVLDQSFWSMTLREVRGRTYVKTLADNIMTGKRGFDLRPMRLNVCAVEVH